MIKNSVRNRELNIKVDNKFHLRFHGLEIGALVVLLHFVNENKLYHLILKAAKLDMNRTTSNQLYKGKK